MGKLGYSTYTLADLTETLPISLVLETNKEQNIQTKEGEFYTPNFETGIEGEELIITPSLFLGSIEREVPTNYSGGSYIYYETGEMEDGSIHEKQYYYYKGNESEEVYVDVEGRLHYKKNLQENLTIEAYIVGFKNKVEQDYITSELVRAQNPITILLLEQGKGIYTLVISSSGNREHFEENNKNDITLTATLYKGAEPILSGVEYEWDIVTDNDDDPNNDFKEEGNIITIQRADVDNIQVYQCTATFNGLEFSSQKIIRDFTDGYTNQLIADSSLILTPNKTTVTLTNQVWYQAQIINEEDANNDRFSYKWILLKSDNANEEELEGTGKTLTIDLNAEKEVVNEETGEIEKINIYSKENFSILGMVTIDKKTVTANYADIKYQPVAYSVNVSPKTIFIPTNADGTYRGTGSFTQEIKFQLLDDKKQSLDYILGTDSFTPQENISVISQTEGKWDFILNFELEDFTGWEENQSSKTYEFKYTYLNQLFTEEFEIVKNYAGQDGQDGSPGFSGYTIDLSNEFHAFAGGEMRADSDQSTTCTISAYFGDQKKKIQTIALGFEGNIIYGTTKTGEDKTGQEYEYILPDSKGALYISSAEGSDTNEVIITIRTNTSDENEKFLMGIEPIKFFITIEKQSQEGQSTETLTFFKTFTYTINYNGKSYELNLSDNNIKYSEPTNTYSPNQITISALCRETSGAARAYSEGKIIYSIDKGKSWEYYENSSIITNNGTKLESIIVRLYSTLAKDITSSTTLNDNLLNENSKYLLDTETIPVLTSMDGYELGGENLIRWSKTLSSGANKWDENSENISITSNGDFSEAVFNGTSAKNQSILKSPKILIPEELRGKTLCLSFDFYCSNYSNLNSTNYATFIAAAAENSTSAKTRWGAIGSIKNTESNSTFIFNETPQNGKWVRVYKTFKLDSSSLNNSASTSTIENCKYFWIEFVAIYNSDFKIKKPKLELGNIPSSWSSSPYDIDYSDIVGANLVTPTKYIWEINGPIPGKEIIVDNLKPDTSYTVSFKNSNLSGLSGNFNICVLKESTSEIVNILTFQGNSSSRQQQTFKTPQARENYQLYFYAGLYSEISDIGRTLKVVELKVEEGITATDFFLTEDYLNSIITNVQTNQDGLQDKVTILTSEGAIIQTDIDNLQDQLAGLSETYVTINSLQGEIEAANEKLYPVPNQGEQGFGAYIAQLRGSIKISAKDTANPYLEIKVADQGTSNSTKLTHDRLSFMSNGKEVAYISNQELCIKNAKFLNSFIIGNSESGELTVSVTETGIGFSW